MTKNLRWLLRRGSPLPIPNREVKPACADGTAILWESMSPPFFENPFSNEGIFFCDEAKNFTAGIRSDMKKPRRIAI